MGEGLIEHPTLVRLKSIVEDKTVCFQSPGPSIGQLGDYLWDIPSDVVWIAQNIFLPVEAILDPICRTLDFVFVSSDQAIRGYGDRYKEFLERSHGLLLTTTGGVEKFKKARPRCLEAHPDKVISFHFGDGLPHSDAFGVLNIGEHSPHVFSLIPMTLALLKANVRRIICFGLDGGRIPGNANWYYGVFEDYPHAWFHGMPGEYRPELEHLHAEWRYLLTRAGFNPDEDRIINCSPHSKINCFPKIDYPDLAKLFEEGRIECQEPSP